MGEVRQPTYKNKDEIRRGIRLWLKQAGKKVTRAR